MAAQPDRPEKTTSSRWRSVLWPRSWQKEVRECPITIPSQKRAKLLCNPDAVSIFFTWLERNYQLEIEFSIAATILVVVGDTTLLWGNKGTVCSFLIDWWPRELWARRVFFWKVYVTRWPKITTVLMKEISGNNDMCRSFNHVDYMCWLDIHWVDGHWMITHEESNQQILIFCQLQQTTSIAGQFCEQKLWS